MITRYERWDGTQEPFGRDADDLIERLAEDLFQGGDFEYSLRRLLARGWRDAQGRRLPGMEEMLERLRQRRQQQLKRYNLNNLFEDIRERLNDILRRERQGITERLQRQDNAAGQRVLQRIARKKMQELDRIPPEVGAAIRALNEYEFMDEGAKQAFDKLMEELKQQIAQTYLKNMERRIQQLRPEHLSEVKEMLKALNQMLRDRLEGRQPDFAGFMRRFGRYFGPNPPKTLDELIQHLERQMAQMESLMQSLSPGMREELEQLIASTFNDRELLEQMAELAAALELLSPRASLGNRYAFYGSESLPPEGALPPLKHPQGTEELEGALRVRAALSRSLQRGARHVLAQPALAAQEIEDRSLIGEADGDRERGAAGAGRIVVERLAGAGAEQRIGDGGCARDVGLRRRDLLLREQQIEPALAKDPQGVRHRQHLRHHQVRRQEGNEHPRCLMVVAPWEFGRTSYRQVPHLPIDRQLPRRH